MFTSLTTSGDLDLKVENTVKPVYNGPVLSGHPRTVTKPHVILCCVLYNLLCLKGDPSSVLSLYKASVS